jgi:hypothetical protein
LGTKKDRLSRRQTVYQRKVLFEDFFDLAYGYIKLFCESFYGDSVDKPPFQKRPITLTVPTSHIAIYGIAYILIAGHSITL